MTSDDATESPRRRPKGDKRARTRVRILEATRQVIREKGYEHTTLQEVARRTGLSNGAIYGNFKSRDDLFAALGPADWPRVRPTIAPGSSFAEKMRAMAEATLAAIPARRRVAVGRLTGLAHTLTNDGLQAQMQNVAETAYAATADWWRAVALADGNDLPMPPEVLVRVLNALAEGLTLQRLLTPDLVPDEVFYAAFAALAGERPSDD
jgi:DNA-binding transcriptional regulator YbjK